MPRECTYFCQGSIYGDGSLECVSLLPPSFLRTSHPFRSINVISWTDLRVDLISIAPLLDVLFTIYNHDF